MQVIGLCRFSYPAIGGFQVEHNSIEERIAFLYAEARLDERFRLFETVALPCLREQTDQDFDLIIVIGDSLLGASRNPAARSGGRHPADQYPEASAASAAPDHEGDPE